MSPNPTLDRRTLLRLLGGAAAGFVCADSGLAVQPETQTGSEIGAAGGASATAPALPARREELLRKPIIVRQAGQLIADRRFVIAPDFAWTPALAAIYVETSDVTIRNVEIVGSETWQERWHRYPEANDGPPGIPTGMVGIRLQRAPRARLLDLVVHGFPDAGIIGFGLADAVIRDVHVHHCFHGIAVKYFERNPRLSVERVKAHDLWGPGAGKWPGADGYAYPSQARPGGSIGGDGIVLESLRQSIVRDCEITGEQFASLKLVNPQDVEISGIRGIQIMVQGTSDLEWKIDTEPARNVRIHDCTLDKRLGSGLLADRTCAMQMSWNIEGLRIENCTFFGAGKGGHAIQFAKNVHGHVVGCTFEGFNGMQGLTPAHAIEVHDHSTVNDDFASVNRFVDQKRILMRS